MSKMQGSEPKDAEVSEDHAGAASHESERGALAYFNSLPPDTITNAADRAYFCEEPTPQQLAQAQETASREVPLAIAGFQEAQQALALDPSNERNVARLADRVGELKQLLEVAEAAAWEPAMGILIARHA